MDKQRRDAPRFILKGKKRGVPEGAAAAGTRPPPSPARGCERSPFPTCGPGRRPRRGALAHGAGGRGAGADHARSPRQKPPRPRDPGPGARRPVENDWAECAGSLLHLPDYSALEIFLSKATEIRGALPWQPAAGMLFGVSGLVKSPTVPISCSSGIIPTSRVLPPPPASCAGSGGRRPWPQGPWPLGPGSSRGGEHRRPGLQPPSDDSLLMTVGLPLPQPARQLGGCPRPPVEARGRRVPT